MKLRALRLIWVGASLLLAQFVAASPMDEESKEIFKRLIAEHAPSVVRVSFVMKSSYQGQEQSQESSATGVVVDARGLILVPRIVVKPTFPGLDKLTNEQKASFKLESRDFRVRFAGQDTPMEAEALSADPDLGIAWLRLKSAKANTTSESTADESSDKKNAAPETTQPAAPYAAVDLGNDAEAAPGQAYYVIERMEDRYGGAPIISWGVLVGEVTVPRRAHVATGAIGLGFSAEGKVLGFVVVDMESMNSDAAMSGQGGIRMTMASAKRIASATQRAASLLEEP